MLVSKIVEICFTPKTKPKMCVSPTLNPNASQWNIGGVGSFGIRACVGHVQFRLFVSISFAFGGQRKCSFQWNMGLTSHMAAFLDIST